MYTVCTSNIAQIEIQRFLCGMKYLAGMLVYVPVAKPRLDIEHVRKPQG